MRSCTRIRTGSGGERSIGQTLSGGIECRVLQRFLRPGDGDMLQREMILTSWMGLQSAWVTDMKFEDSTRCLLDISPLDLQNYLKFEFAVQTKTSTAYVIDANVILCTLAVTITWLLHMFAP